MRHQRETCLCSARRRERPRWPTSPANWRMDSSVMMRPSPCASSASAARISARWRSRSSHNENASCTASSGRRSLPVAIACRTNACCSNESCTSITLSVETGEAFCQQSGLQRHWLPENYWLITPLRPVIPAAFTLAWYRELNSCESSLSACFPGAPVRRPGSRSAAQSQTCQGVGRAAADRDAGQPARARFHQSELCGRERAVQPHQRSARQFLESARRLRRGYLEQPRAGLEICKPIADRREGRYRSRPT